MLQNLCHHPLSPHPYTPQPPCCIQAQMAGLTMHLQLKAEPQALGQ